MPFSQQDITDAGFAVLDNYLRNNPVDQIEVERVLLKTLMANTVEAAGAKQYIVEQLRYQYQSNFQWFNGAQQVTYNRRQTLQQAQYPWRSAHDGCAIDEDRLVQHGIEVSDTGPGGQASGAERQILSNLLEEQMAALRLGWEEQFSKYLHLDGTVGGTDALTGLSGLVSLTPTAGTAGGLNRATNVWWRNYAATGLTTTTNTGTILDFLEIAFRNCLRNGGRPNKIIVGSNFYDGFRNFMVKTYGKMDYGTVGFKRVATGTDMLTFHGVEVEWAPEFQDFDAQGLGGGTAWENRCYIVNTKLMKLRPMQGHNMMKRKPPRPYDRYEYYWALTWRGALTMSRGNAHAVLAI